MRGFGVWLSRGNAGWVAGVIGFIVITYLVIAED